MLAERLPRLLPPLDDQAALVATVIHSVAGTLPPGAPLVTRPTFEAPHHRFENQPGSAQDRTTQRLIDRIWQLNAPPELRNIIGQSISSFRAHALLGR
jgi:hypothetical protein